jgi:hypothetical protein
MSRLSGTAPNASKRLYTRHSGCLLLGALYDCIKRKPLCEHKDGRTPTASRQASRHETKETKADVSIMIQTGVRQFS